MARISPAAAHFRAKHAALSRAVKNGERPADDPALIDARRGLAVEQLAEHAHRVVDGWPAPTPEQLQRVAAILLTATPGGDSDAAAA